MFKESEEYNLKELAEYWSKAVAGDFILPNNPYLYPQCKQINTLGKSILELIERIERIEEKLK